MELRYHLLDVFTDVRFGGNPLAVFLDAPPLETALMQRIARELNLSETVFVLPPKQYPAALRRLRIFTPAMELPFAGHPSVGTGHLLSELGYVTSIDSVFRFSLEELAGLVPVTVRRAGLVAPLVQITVAKLPEAGPPPPSAARLAAMLGLKENEIGSGDDAPQAVSAGVPFLLVPVTSRDVLGRSVLDVAMWRETLAEWWAPHLYLFCRDAGAPGVDLRARMYGPATGILEDPATGAAAAALAGYLGWKSTMQDGVLNWKLEQGIEMGRPSLLELTAEKKGGAITAVHVGGRSVLVGEGVLRI